MFCSKLDGLLEAAKHFHQGYTQDKVSSSSLTPSSLVRTFWGTRPRRSVDAIANESAGTAPKQLGLYRSHKPEPDKQADPCCAGFLKLPNVQIILNCGLIWVAYAWNPFLEPCQGNISRQAAPRPCSSRPMWRTTLWPSPEAQKSYCSGLGEIGPAAQCASTSSEVDLGGGCDPARVLYRLWELPFPVTRASTCIGDGCQARWSHTPLQSPFTWYKQHQSLHAALRPQGLRLEVVAVKTALDRVLMHVRSRE